MRYHILIFLFLGPISFCCAQPNVLFGERSISRDIAAVFYDKDGNIYPDYFIADSSLTRSSASLADWYKDHPADFEKICGAYHCPFDKFAYDKLPVLNDSIAAMVRRSIEAKRNGLNSITFLVHGYRKPFNSLNGDSPSPRDFRMLETAMNNYNNGRMLYVEVYWDGMLTGVNIEATVALAQALTIPVIASGGVTNLEDVRKLCAVASEGIIGTITGRAIYEGTLDFTAAQKLADELSAR